jgi:cytochrome c-type biogenesis protein CcmH
LKPFSKKHTSIRLLFFSSFLFIICILSCNTEESTEEIAQRIDRSLMCPICPAETLDQSQSELAKQMKTVIRDKISEGKTDEEIINYFVERYGEEVLNLFAWITPVMILIVITLIISFKLVKKSIVTNNEI